LFGVRVNDATKSSIFAPSCFVQKPIVWSHLSNKQKDGLDISFQTLFHTFVKSTGELE
jgi:hypothetical protein